MFPIYDRTQPAGVPNWAWFFGALRRLARGLNRVGPDNIKAGTVTRQMLEPGFWVRAEGVRVTPDPTSLFDTWNLHKNEYGGEEGIGEIVTVSVRKNRVTLNSSATGSFAVAYSIRVPELGVGISGNVSQRRGVYSTLHIDGRRIDEATDYDNKRSELNGDRLNGFAFVNLIEGTHQVEVMLHTAFLTRVLRIEISFGEIH